MAYIGNTATTQAFTPAVDYFNGDGSTVAFTLSKPVASVAQVQAVIENVPQNPGSAYTVSGNTITFTSAPPSGTANIYVYYTSPITQVIAPSQGTVGSSQLQSNLALTGSLTVDGTTLVVDDTNNRVGIGTSSASAGGLLTLNRAPTAAFGSPILQVGGSSYTSGGYYSVGLGFTDATYTEPPAEIAYVPTSDSGGTKGSIVFGNRDVTTNTAVSERMRIASAGQILFGKSTEDDSVFGANFKMNNDSTTFNFTQTNSGGSGWVIMCNRQGSDGTLMQFRQANTDEGNISVSGTTVSYNGGHLSRWAQTTGPKDETLVKGTVLSNLDEMNVYTDADGNPVDNEQLNKVKVSDVEGDANVAGVFVNWSYDEQHSVDEINMAMTGDMIIRIAQGATVARGDLLMSAGDGTAKPQGDDIVRSKTIAKVTSTHVTCTYEDGSYCVPCVLMAC